MTLRDLFWNGRKTSGADAASVKSAPDSMLTAVAQEDSDESDGREDGISGLSTQKLKTFFDRRAEDIFIVLDEPHKIYGPGDAVRGKVNLVLNKPTKTLYTAMRFCGQVSVGVGNQVAKTMLFQDNLILWGHMTKDANDKSMTPDPVPSSVEEQDQQAALEQISRSTSAATRPLQDGNLPPKALTWEIGTMDQGRHVFEFEFQFPRSNLPSTVDFGRGSISYSLRCEHQKPKSLTSRGRSTCRKNLTVLDIIDIGCLPIPKIRHIDPDLKSKRKEGAGKVQAYVELVRAGYLKGDTIALNIQVHHVKPIKNMRGTIATLYRLSRFDSNDIAPQSFRKDLSQIVSPLLVDPQSLDYRISPRLRIPSDAFPTIKAAGPVSFRYFVEVVLDLNGRTTVWQSGAGSASGDGSCNFSIETGGEAMETDSLKREKGSHCVVFEVTIGTKDTSISKGRQGTLSSFSGHMRDHRSRTTSLTSQGPPSETDHGSVANHSLIDSRERSTNSRQSSYATLPLSSGRQPIYSGNSSQYPLSKADIQRIEDSMLPSEPPATALAPSVDCESPVPSAPSLEVVRSSSGHHDTNGWVSARGYEVAAAIQDGPQRIHSVPRVALTDRQTAPSQKEEEALREQISAPPEDDPVFAGSAPSLDLFSQESGAVENGHIIQLPVYKGH